MKHQKMIQHLKSRHLNPYLYTSVSMTDEVVVFPLWNLSHQMVGYQQYRPTGTKAGRGDPKRAKYFTWVRKERGKPAVTAWGLDHLRLCKGPIFLVEGVFKACRFHNHGLNALATLSNDPKFLKGWLESLGYEVRPICDGDAPGRKLAKYGTRPVLLPEGSYVDEMRESDFIQLLSELSR